MFLENCHLDDIAGDSITVNSFPKEACSAIFLKPFFNTILQHSLLAFSLAPAVTISSALGKPNSVPITFQSVA